MLKAKNHTIPVDTSESIIYIYYTSSSEGPHDDIPYCSNSVDIHCLWIWCVNVLDYYYNLTQFWDVSTAQIITVSAGDQSLSSNEQLRVLTVIEGSNLIFTCSTTDSGGLVSATSSINLVESPGGTATSKEYTVENVQRTNISPTTTFSCADETNNLIFTLDILCENFNLAQLVYILV